MKKEKSKAKGTISQLVLGLIKARGLSKPGHNGKDGVAVISEVKKKFPGSKFSQSHYAWYLSRFKKQQRDGLGVDKLHYGRSAKKAAKHRRAK